MKSQELCQSLEGEEKESQKPALPSKPELPQISDGRNIVQTPKYKFTIYGLHDSRDVFRTVMYVGKTSRPIKSRMYGHWKNKKSGRRGAWQAKLESEGATALPFIIETIKSDDPNAWREAEFRWVEHYRKLNPNLLNDVPGGYGPGEFSVEVRERMSRVHLGKKWPPEQTAKMRVIMTGRKATPETLEKLSAFWKGRKKSPEQIAKMRLVNLGKTISQETRDKIGAAHRGKKHSPEWTAKIAAANAGQGLGGKLSPEIRQKMREAQLLRWKIRKGLA